MPVYTVSGIKTFRGHEGDGFNANLLKDGKKVALVMDDASGGESRFEWVDYKAPRVAVPWVNYQGNPFTLECTPEEASLYEHIRGKHWSFDGEDRGQIDPALFVSELVDSYETSKKLKKWCKTQTVFRLEGDAIGSYRLLRIPYSDPRARDFLIRTHGVKITELYDTQGNPVTMPLTA